MIRKLEYAVPPEFAGRTVLSFLRANGYSARVITGLKQNPHGIMLRNKKVTVQKTLKAGDTLVIYIRDKAGENVVPRDIPLDIPFEDRDVAVVNKPAGMATHPSQDNYDTSLANALAFHFQSRGEDVTVRSVNRLDKNTSGLVLIAKNQLAAAKLSAELKNGGVHKEYLALVEGVPDDCGTVDAPIARAPGSTIERMVSESGERAVTHYKLLLAGGFSLLRLTLETGRTHQIRVHMSHIGHPVAGDFLYGTEFSGGMLRHALHASRLSFTHPVTGETVDLFAPLPDDMSALCKKQWGEKYEALGI